MIVAKFGGSSLADAEQFKKVRNIVMADSRRQVIVPSAPGKRFNQDDKVTDLLYECYQEQLEGLTFGTNFEKIRKRYLDIADELKLSIDLVYYLDEVEQKIKSGASSDYCVSRGEFLNGLLLAEYLGFSFLDAAEVICFDENGVFDSEKTNAILSVKLKQLIPVVLPGFYGSDPDGNIRVFSRGGSDISGALAARAVKAELYENWTDVSGFLMADPRIVENPRHISHITYNEMHALSSAGASVLHEDSVFPVSIAEIPTNIRNTNLPEHPGTMITSTAVQRESFSIFAGVAGKKGFSLVVIEKQIFDSSRAFYQKVIQAAKNCGLSFQHLPSNINTICLMVNSQQYKIIHEVLEKEIQTISVPYSMTVHERFAYIVLVGYGIIHNQKTLNRVYAALTKGNIPVALINQGSCELSTWIGVSEAEMENAIRTLYQEFSN